ncbi:MAG: CsgG/HfaB family protein [Gemmatimonadota bacterium]|jgi:tetratricopeptide (TPR) repeat protein
MTHPPRRSWGRYLIPVIVLGQAACATGLPEVEAVDLPRLEQEVAAAPGDTDLQVQLGMAQFKAGDLDAAQATLRGAIDAGNESGAAYLYLGMVQEERQDWSAARDAYNQYLTVGSSSEAREEVRKRLTLIGRNLLRAQAQQALAQEAEIADTEDVTPRSVAVLPMAFNSDREDLEPLIYALSDMMTTDFAVSNALVVLERSQIQALLDEMALTSSGYAEQTTGARAGRMLRAEHVFQGVLTTLGDDELQTDADILNVPNTTTAGELTEAAQLENLFDMEKQVVIRTIREVLGVELTPAEEQAILENRMDNVLAFLAYGRGLREIDRGNYEGARAEFEQSIQLEPGGFGSRTQAIDEVDNLIEASSMGTGDLSDLASTTGEFGVGAFAPPPAAVTQGLSTAVTGSGGLAGTLEHVTQGVAPRPTTGTLDRGTTDSGTEQTDTTRDPVQEATGTESLTGTVDAQITIVIPRPGAE